ncbi:nuclear transport factor 2 family protein [Pedobacter sp. UBA5917]|jgi:limonene-1,2-epoxide hydrolase|uniref:nuclear transport factor 2 family protein n=1 Tax=Pedobacter sp. UBA5917 TaxID=1947061 RepID=UPI0025F2F654|nr:nuclear transport factor 2 family protein [Pedobacter sp. UBA5917]
MTNTDHTITDEEKATIANSFVAALRNNDWENMLNILVPDATWTLPGTSLLSGPANGADAIVKRVQNLKKFGVNFDLKYILIGLNGFTLSLHNTSRREELILDEQVAIVFEISERKISKMATYLSDVEGINRFFVPGIID